MKIYGEDEISSVIVDIMECIGYVNINIDKILREIEGIELPKDAKSQDCLDKIMHTKYELTSYLEAYCEHLQVIKKNYEIYDDSNDLPLAFKQRSDIA